MCIVWLPFLLPLFLLLPSPLVSVCCSALPFRHTTLLRLGFRFLGSILVFLMASVACGTGCAPFAACAFPAVGMADPKRRLTIAISFITMLKASGMKSRRPRRGCKRPPHQQERPILWRRRFSSGRSSVSQKASSRCSEEAADRRGHRSVSRYHCVPHKDQTLLQWLTQRRA